jgi:hypothetical protein
MKIILFLIVTVFILAGCTPNIGVGIGGVVVSDDGIAASEVVADSQTGIHGSVTMGSDMRL